VILTSGEQAAMAIQPFAGTLAAKLFAIGILNAGFMGLVVVSLSTAYAFAEFFGLSGSLNDSFKQSKTFYFLYLAQLAIATLPVIVTQVNLFQVALVTQIINAIALPLVFFFLISLSNDRNLMGEFANNNFQKYFSVISSIVIVIASLFTVIAVFLT
jgi:Mn2+/Fe2+ NRAMP family transporter